MTDEARATRSPIPAPRAPALTSTYRVQLNAAFDFEAARAVVPYLARLGVSHLYCSPVLAARPGSAHGYDVVDPTRASPELGGEDGFRALAAEVKARGMGLLLDIVPNHMSAAPENAYWADVLTWGRESRYASWFDLDWRGDGAARGGKIVLPVLGDPLDVVLARDELRVVPRGDGHAVAYHEHRFPLDPRTVPRPLSADAFAGDDAGRGRMRALLAAQAYASAHWRSGLRDVNYRRFFDVNDLLGVRVEDPAVFDATHARLLEWVGDGLVDGVRVDHVDGLRDPLGYLRRLRRALDARRPGEHVPVFVEKILASDEALAEAWPVDGTTGYEFAAAVDAAQVDPAGYDTIAAAYRRLLRVDRRGVTFEDIARRGKELTLRRALQPDVRRLVRLLDPVARAAGVSLSKPQLGEAIVQFLVELSVYRTYVRVETEDVDGRAVTRWETSAEDRAVVARAVAGAVGRGAARAEAVAFVARVLLGDAVVESASGVAPAPRRASRVTAAERARDFAMRLQQASSPATAKGVEDTAFYRWYPVASLCEVGGGPMRPAADAVARLHASNAERRRARPRSLTAATTHDTKRSADVRARLDALSEVPNEWAEFVRRWRARHAPMRGRVGDRWVPDANAEYLLYQTLVGIWPLGAAGEGDELSAQTRVSLADRVADYLRKARREAKAQTSWTEPNAAYEKAVDRFARALVLDDARADFRGALAALVRRVGRAGMWNSLSRLVLQSAAPGTPDVYQGDELWLHALVDPDNRRPVDYATRAAAIAAMEESADADRPRLCAELLRRAADGRVKAYVLHRALTARREDPELFARGAYVPLGVTGERAWHVVAFARVCDGRGVVAVAPRLTLALRPDAGPPLGHASWGDTAIELPAGMNAEFTDLFGGHSVCTPGRLSVSDALSLLPVALLRTR